MLRGAVDGSMPLVSLPEHAVRSTVVAMAQAAAMPVTAAGAVMCTRIIDLLRESIVI